MSKSFSPLRYPGGKSCIFPFVSNLIIENNLVGCKYVEPYAGGAGLALRLLYEEYAETVVINDLDPLVYAFWNVCVNENERFIDWISRTRVSVTTWKRCRETIRNHNCEDAFELATSFFFLNRTNVSGVLNGGIIGGLNQKGNYKIDARYNKEALIRKVEKIGRFKERIQVTGIDGVNLLKKYSRQTQNVFIYIDPPYFEKGSNLYLNSYSKEDHERLSQRIKKIKTPWMLSYDNHYFILELYHEFNRRAYRLQHSTSNKIGDEVIVFPPGLAFDRSIETLNQPIPI